MPKWISPFQSSFVLGRAIHDNIIITQEIIHSMKKLKEKKGFMIIKLDLDKGYDRIQWDIIEKVLNGCNIPPNARAIIMKCINSTSLNVLWNGSLTGNFNPSRASPLIFSSYAWINSHNLLRKNFKKALGSCLEQVKLESLMLTLCLLTMFYFFVKPLWIKLME